MLVDCATYLDGRRIDGYEPIPHHGFSWVGLVEPTNLEIEQYQRQFGLTELAVEDAQHGKQRPKLDVYHDHAFIFLRTAMYDTRTERVVFGDMALFVAEHFVVTVRHGDAIPMRSIRADMELRPSRLAQGPTAVLHEVLDRLVDQYVEVAQKLREDVEDLEDLVFDDEKPAPSARLYSVKREVLEFRRGVLPLLQPLERLASMETAHVSGGFKDQFADVHDHLLRVIDEVTVLGELMDAALTANLTLIQVQQNTDMRKISAWAGIAAVPTMIAGIYGMNFDHMPELGWRYGYFVILGTLGLVSWALFRVFRRNSWL